MADDDTASELGRLVAEADRQMSGSDHPAAPFDAPPLDDDPASAPTVEREVGRQLDRHDVPTGLLPESAASASAPLTSAPSRDDDATPHVVARDSARPSSDPTLRMDRAPGATSGAIERPHRAGTRAFRMRRRVVRWSALVVLAAFGYFAVTLAQVWQTGRSDHRDPVDAIVVMGAAQYDGRPSPQLAARLDHVVELWPLGVAPLVVVTGGNLPGDRFTEAQASAGYLIERGIPSEALIFEDQGSNSYESLAAVDLMLEARGLNEVVIVTDPYHALRSELIAEEVGLAASVSSTTTSVVTGADSMVRHAKEAVGVAVGRIIGFRRLTDLAG